MEQNRSQKLFYSLEELINDVFGQDISIIRMDSVLGGDINNAYRLSLSNEDSLFVKTNSVNNLNFFLTESGGLRALRSLKKSECRKFWGQEPMSRGGFHSLRLNI